MSETVVFSTAEGMVPAAADELRAAVPAARSEPVAPGTGLLSGSGVDITDVARRCRTTPVVFVRHLARVVTRVPIAAVAADPACLVTAARETLVGEAPSSIALQMWQDGNPPLPQRTDELWHMVAEGLTTAGYEVGRAGREWVLSICLTPREALVGLNRREDALSDWPGGRVRLSRPPGQISRAEFKLEELFRIAPVRLPAQGTALDLGASPGGWTRVLRQAGLEVWAVDPADLDPRLVPEPGVHHVRTTAGAFLAENRRTFDLVVNDMRMTAEQSASVMLSAATHLAPAGLAIMTLKLPERDPLATVHRALDILRRAYTIDFARQLHHNRHEVTVVATRTRPGRAGATRGRGHRP